MGNLQKNTVENKAPENTPEPAGKSGWWLMVAGFIFLMVIIWGLIFYILSIKGTFSKIIDWSSGKSVAESTETETLDELQNNQPNNQLSEQELASNIPADASQDNGLEAPAAGTDEINTGGTGAGNNEEDSGQAEEAAAEEEAEEDAETEEEEAAAEEEAEEDAEAEEEEAEEEIPLDDYDFNEAMDSIYDSFNSLSSSAVYDPAQLNKSEFNL